MYHHVNEDVDYADRNYYYEDLLADDTTAIVDEFAYADRRIDEEEEEVDYSASRKDPVELTHNGSRLLTVDEILQHLDELEQSLELERQDPGSDDDDGSDFDKQM